MKGASPSRRPIGRRLAIEELESRRVLALSVNLGSGSLYEGTSIATATVARLDGDMSAALVVTLSTGDASEASVPPSVTIPANQASTTFALSTVADGLVDDAVTVAITATAAGHASAQASLQVLNADLLALRPGAAADTITLTPSTTPGRYAVAGATGDGWATPLIDLSAPSSADERAWLQLGQGSPWSSATSLIKINPAERYVVYSVTEVGRTSADNHPLGFAAYDVDQLLIEPIHVARYALAVDTALAAPLNPGDASILVDDASGWSNLPWESATTRTLAWFGYADSTSHVYADYTYTRNVAAGGDDGLWAPGAIEYDAAAGAYRIHLLNPWSGPALAAGAAIRNADAGALHHLPTLTETSSGSLATYKVTIGGAVWQEGARSETAFRPGTAYIRPVVTSSVPWTGVAIAPEQDAITFGPLSFMRPTAEANALREIVLDFDVLAKNAFGAGANVVIDSVAAPAQGTASVASGYGGRQIVKYRSTPAFTGEVTIAYTLRNTATQATYAGQIILSVVDNAEEIRQSRLHSVALAMLNYDSALGRFPLTPTASNFDGSGNPYLSWRVHLLPYMGYQSLYNQFHLNEPWNSPHNLPLAAQMPELFRDPLADPSSTLTRFRIISGEGSNYYWRRSNGLLAGPTQNAFQDGEAHSFLVVETGADAAVKWTQPDLPNFDPANPLAALGTITSDRINGVTADAKPLSLPASVSPSVFASLVTIDGGELLDANTLRRQFAASQGPAALAAFDAASADNYFAQIALGMLNHESAQSRFPVSGSTTRFDSGGSPLLSWRVHILPYFGYINLYQQFHLDEAWNSPHNLPLAALMPDVFRSAGDAADATTTRLMTFTGSQAPFGYREPGTTQLGPRAVDIVDGFSNTIMFVEAGTDVAVPWTKPADISLNVADPLAAVGNLPNGNLRAAMFDSARRTFSTALPTSTLAALATRAGGENVSAANAAAGPPGAAIQNVRNIAQAMLDYRSVHQRFATNRFASDGTPLLSWRVAMLPYLGYTSLYNQFHQDEPWDSPHNLALLEFMPPDFRAVEAPMDATTTQVATFVGAGAPFPASGTSATLGPRLQDITDGTQNTYMIVEAGADRAVPWTKPVDLPYHVNNPRSALGDVGKTFLAATFSGAVSSQSASLATNLLSSAISHQGATSSATPAATPFIQQSHGDTRIAEFGADWFDVVFDAAPSTPQTLLMGVSNPAVAVLDKQSLIFDATNWNVPQRVVVRGIDDYRANPDRTIVVTVGAQSLNVTLVNDDPASADFDASGRVDGADFLAWQRGFGTTTTAQLSQGDANGDENVDAVDLAIWASADDNFAQEAAVASVPSPTAPLNNLGAWEAAFSLLGSNDSESSTTTTGRRRLRPASRPVYQLGS